MTAFTDFAEDLLAKWLFDDVAATRPTAWFVALHTADPGETGAAGEITGAGGYARQAATFTANGNGTTDNDATITFGPATGADWGTITHVSVWDASTSGNCLIKGALTASKAVAVGDSLQFAAAALVPQVQ